MLIDLVGGGNLLKFIVWKIGEKEFTFSECLPMKTEPNSKFMTLFGEENRIARFSLFPPSNADGRNGCKLFDFSVVCAVHHHHVARGEMTRSLSLSPSLSLKL
jgi:hypothetical protein